MIQRVSKRQLLAQALASTGCNRLLHLGRSWRGVLILNYHRIGDPAHSPLDRDLWSATVDEFDRQVGRVMQDFDVIGLDDLEIALHRPNSRCVLITFDDGYLDNYTEAFPILKRHNARATFFITTGFLDVPQVPWWDEIAWMVRNSPIVGLPENPWTKRAVSFENPDRSAAIVYLLNVYKRTDGRRTRDYLEFLAAALKCGRCPEHVAHELWMTWHMIREMRQAHMDVGAHTVNHPILANLTPEEQNYEIGESRRRLMHELKEPVYAFSYPVGGQSSFNEHTRAALERHGYRWGFTYIGGNVKPMQFDRFALPRAAIELDIHGSLFQAVTTLPQIFS